jgi:formylglycine-generating enzyme required for sulfatase activity
MSNEIVVAIISLIGVILGSLISAFATIFSSRTQTPPSKSGLVYPPGYKAASSKKINYKWIGIGSFIGLVFGFILAISIKPLGSSTAIINNIVTDTPSPSDTPFLMTASDISTEAIIPSPTFTITLIPTATFTPTFTPAVTFTASKTFTPTPVLILDQSIPMILIPEGTFNKYDKDKGYIKVHLLSYYMDQHEVTNSQYKECVTANICREPFTDVDREYENVKHFGDDRYANFPVVLVSYHMAKTYCEWRGERTRMPTGEEWEKAARGLLLDQTYPWGNNPPSCELGTVNGANYSGCNTRDAFPVASFAPNGYGLFDMSGNVSEWVDEANKLIRGGSWNDGESRIKVYTTSEGYTFDGYVNVGFRCAKDVQ